MDDVAGQLDIHLMIRNRLAVHGSSIRYRTTSEKAQLLREFNDSVMPSIEDGGLTPVVDSVFALADVEEAALRMEQGLNFGKVVVSINTAP